MVGSSLSLGLRNTVMGLGALVMLVATNPRVMGSVLGILLLDIVRSNVTVALQVLGPEAKIRPGFIWVPLDIANIHGIAALTSIITLTPGTVSSALSDDRRYLLVHVLNLDDAERVVRQIKTRYEAPLMEIFP